MSELRNILQDQSLLRAEADQLSSELWEEFFGNGEEWVERLNQMLLAFMEHDADPWRTVGTLAQIGFLRMLSEKEPNV